MALAAESALQPMSRLPLVCSLAVCVSVSILIAVPARAQTPPPPGRNEVEQNVVNLPTTQPMRATGHHFRVTHRFARDWNRGTFGQLAADLFGLDSGAIIGLEYRFAPTSRIQTGIYRSMLFKTIQVSGRVDVWQQDEAFPIGLSFLASVEGTDNMRDDHAPALGFVASRSVGQLITLYASPTFVWNTSAVHEVEVDDGHDDHDHGVIPSPLDDGYSDTAYVGIGARLRIRSGTFLVGEFSPRVWGHSPGRGIWGAAIEKQTRGHVFQLNFTNSFGTTFGQIASGGDTHNVYLGFNIARRF